MADEGGNHARKARNETTKTKTKQKGFQSMLVLKSKPRSFSGESEESPKIKVVTIKGTVHYNQSDFPFVLNWFGKLWLKVNSWRNKFTAHDLTIALTLDFISKHFYIPVPDERNLFLNLEFKKLKFGIRV